MGLRVPAGSSCIRTKTTRCRRVNELWHDGRCENTQVWFILLRVDLQGYGERLYLYYLWSLSIPLLSRLTLSCLFPFFFHLSVFLLSPQIYRKQTHCFSQRETESSEETQVFFYHPRQKWGSSETSLCGLHLWCWVLKKRVRTWRCCEMRSRGMCSLMSSVMSLGWGIKIKRAFIPEGPIQLNSRQPVCDKGLNPGQIHFLVLFLSCICFNSFHKLVFQSICCVNDRGHGSPSTEAPVHHSWQVLIFLIRLPSRWGWV